ncbi:MAG: ABC transporter ATP-binding protein/permease, partial [Planctomycetota bacterium]|nr:ABC transporter ATP-binding protein/permease [Planctomycetota bacterium]
MTVFLRMLRLAWKYPARLLCFIAAGFSLGAMGGAIVGVSHVALDILDTAAPPAWAAERFGIHEAQTAFYALLAAASGVLLIKCALSYSERYLEAWLTHRLLLDTQDKLAAHLLRLDLAYFHRERAGEIISRLTNDLHFLGRSVKFACVLLTTPLALCWYLAVLFYLSWQLALLGLMAAPLGGWGMAYLSRKMRDASRRAQEKRADLTNALVQFLAGIRIVKAFSCEDFEAREFSEENRRLFQVAMKRERARALERPLAEFMSACGTLAVLAVGGAWVFHAGLRPADLGAFIIALGLMYGPAKELSRANSDLQEALPGAERVFKIFDLQPKVKEGSAEMPPFQRSICFENVSFAYTPEMPVLRDITFTVNKGERVALVGPSAAGKSTLLDLLMRFYDPDRGRIAIDGIDLRQVTFQSLRRQIAMVCQEPFLFNCSIRDNIAYGRSDATAEAIEAAAKAALARAQDRVVRRYHALHPPLGKNRPANGDQPPLCLLYTS